MDPREALTREALRLHQRYQHELVERFSVCPWAKPARTDGRVHAHVVTESPCSVETLGSALASWVADETVDVAFVILPLFDEGPDALTYGYDGYKVRANPDASLTIELRDLPTAEEIEARYDHSKPTSPHVRAAKA